MMKKTYNLTYAQMIELTKKLAHYLEKGFILLEGDLGSGKTSFVQEFLRHRGLEGVTSPTYSLVHHYQTEHGKIFHADLYRIEYATQLRDLELEFYQDELFFIEWGSRFADHLQPVVAHISIHPCSESHDKRSYHLELFDPFSRGYCQDQLLSDLS